MRIYNLSKYLIVMFFSIVMLHKFSHAMSTITSEEELVKNVPIGDVVYDEMPDGPTYENLIGHEKVSLDKKTKQLMIGPKDPLTDPWIVQNCYEDEGTLVEFDSIIDTKCYARKIEDYIKRNASRWYSVRSNKLLFPRYPIIYENIGEYCKDGIFVHRNDGCVKQHTFDVISYMVKDDFGVFSPYNTSIPKESGLWTNNIYYCVLIVLYDLPTETTGLMHADYQNTEEEVQYFIDTFKWESWGARKTKAFVTSQFYSDHYAKFLNVLKRNEIKYSARLSYPQFFQGKDYENGSKYVFSCEIGGEHEPSVESYTETSGGKLCGFYGIPDNQHNGRNFYNYRLGAHISFNGRLTVFEVPTLGGHDCKDNWIRNKWIEKCNGRPYKRYGDLSYFMKGNGFALSVDLTPTLGAIKKRSLNNKTLRVMDHLVLKSKRIADRRNLKIFTANYNKHK